MLSDTDISDNKDGNRKKTSVPIPDTDRNSSEPPKYLAYTLLIGNPNPS
jgi:hypothetical protein